MDNELNKLKKQFDQAAALLSMLTGKPVKTRYYMSIMGIIESLRCLAYREDGRIL